jgi:hypothetical protein
MREMKNREYNDERPCPIPVRPSNRAMPIPGLRIGPLAQKKVVSDEINCGIAELYEYKCIVLPDPPDEVTAGGIIKAKDAVRLEALKTCKATFIMGSENAFRDWGNSKPQLLDRVYVAVASGMVHQGPDGREYRIVNDKDVIGRLAE